MKVTSNPIRNVAVIGGGITGLAAAHRLGELDRSLKVTVLEASGRLGGVLHTERHEGFCIEQSAENFVTNLPWALDLARRVGLGDQIIPTNPARVGAFVVHAGRLKPIPAGFALLAPTQIWPLATTSIFSIRGKLRLALEYFVPRRKTNGDESLASFARRRLGNEVFERLVQPLVSGIYAADPEKLSVGAALPQFVEMERRYRSLARGARRQAAQRYAAQSTAGARYSLFATPKHGLSSLVDAVAARLPSDSIELNAPAERIAAAQTGGWTVELGRSSAGALRRPCDALIVATPAPQAARLLADVDAPLADDLREISYGGCVLVTVAYKRRQISHPLDGYGFVVPNIERRPILACSFSSVKFSHRAPDGHALLRVFLGGACEDQPDEVLQRIVAQQLGSLIGVSGNPLICRIQRFKGTMPQYHVGHLQRVRRIEDRVACLPGLELAGNAYHGVGVPQCVRSGEQAAERLVRLERDSNH